MTIERALIAALTLCACGQSTLAPAQPGAPANASLFVAQPVAQWRLPNRLREISGLALTADGRLFGHDDERAVIYEIDIAQGALGKAFAVGEPAETGDFEGLAITPAGEFWLTTSRGGSIASAKARTAATWLSSASTQAFATFARWRALPTWRQRKASFSPAKATTIAACETLSHFTRGQLAAETPRLGARFPRLQSRRRRACARLPRRAWRSIRARGRILLLSARDGALAEFDADGGLLAARRLGAEHVQAEGMTVTAEGALVIADEGARAQALISVYERIHD